MIWRRNNAATGYHLSSTYHFCLGSASYQTQAFKPTLIIVPAPVSPHSSSIAPLSALVYFDLQVILHACQRPSQKAVLAFSFLLDLTLRGHLEGTFLLLTDVVTPVVRSDFWTAPQLELGAANKASS